MNGWIESQKHIHSGGKKGKYQSEKIKKGLRSKTHLEPSKKYNKLPSNFLHYPFIRLWASVAQKGAPNVSLLMCNVLKAHFKLLKTSAPY